MFEGQVPHDTLPSLPSFCLRRTVVHRAELKTSRRLFALRPSTALLEPNHQDVCITTRESPINVSDAFFLFLFASLGELMHRSAPSSGADRVKIDERTDGLLLP